MGGRLWLRTDDGSVRADSVAALVVRHSPELPEQGTGYDTDANPADFEWFVQARLIGDDADPDPVVVACGDGIVAVDQVVALTREIAAHQDDVGLIAVQTVGQDATDTKGDPVRLDVVIGVGFTSWAPAAGTAPIAP